MPRRLAVLVVVLGALAAAGPAMAQEPPGLGLGTCPRLPGFECGTLQVPLDRTGAVPGTLDLRVAAARARSTDRGVLLALSGGPGQGAVAFAPSFALSLGPALANRRLVVIDQRGTGAGAIDCPALQRLGSLAAYPVAAVAACGEQLGPARTSYATIDTVDDLEALRIALGVSTLGLMGVSYGTWVAQQYARAYPDRVDALILDSVVPPSGVQPYLLDTFSRVPRILREQCAAGRCAGVTRDPVADLGAAAARVRAGDVRGTVIDARGRPVVAALRDERELMLLLLTGDLNPYLQAALPGALAAAGRGDPASLLRLRRIASLGDTSPADLSAGLNVATACADTALPYRLDSPLAGREEAWRAGLTQPDSAFAPFSRAAVLGLSSVHDCLRWPPSAPPRPPATGPLPDVPALVLSGRLDLRTPLENARELVAQLPRAQLVTLAGAGHDVLDADLSGCAARALRRFAAGVAVGTPCAGRSNAVGVLAVPPARLENAARADGVPGARGRVVAAALGALLDARITAGQLLYAGASRLAGGGLRGGDFALSNTGERLVADDLEYVPGVRVSGTLHTTGQEDRLEGTVQIDGPGRLDGPLTLDGRGGAAGTIGGVAVRTRAAVPSGRAARVTAAAARRPALVAAR